LKQCGLDSQRERLPTAPNLHAFISQKLKKSEMKWSKACRRDTRKSAAVFIHKWHGQYMGIIHMHSSLKTTCIKKTRSALNLQGNSSYRATYA
jgi:hypothetical protein